MLESLVGSTSAERVLMFLTAREIGYAREIAQAFDVAPSQIQRVLDRMERDGLLVSGVIGRTRLYEFNPHFAFREQVRALFKDVIEKSPSSVQSKLLENRRRPRRKAKPL